MKIECKLHRKDGTLVELGTKTYHFKPLADGAHVAEVADEQHQDRLLSISEAYGIYRGASETAKPAAPVAPVEPAQPADYDREALEAQYEAKFHKKPHYNLNIDKLRAALAAG